MLDRRGLALCIFPLVGGPPGTEANLDLFSHCDLDLSVTTVNTT